jgi:hypothetical protein
MVNTPESPQSGGYQTSAPPYGNQPPATPPYGSAPPTAPAAKPGTNGLAIAGLILAFLAAPIGFILSLVGLIQAGRRGQAGKGLAIAGIIVSIILMAIGGVVIAAAVKVAPKVATVADPGCTSGKAAILDNATKASDPATVKEGLQATVDGLTAAVGKAKHDNVRTALQTLLDDYTELLKDVNTGTQPDPNLTTKIQTDANAVDSLCTIGGK